jgi:hypothetical protein
MSLLLLARFGTSSAAQAPNQDFSLAAFSKRLEPSAAQKANINLCLRFYLSAIKRRIVLNIVGQGVTPA